LVGALACALPAIAGAAPLFPGKAGKRADIASLRHRLTQARKILNRLVRRYAPAKRIVAQRKTVNRLARQLRAAKRAV
jgi:hypothetical protein